MKPSTRAWPSGIIAVLLVLLPGDPLGITSDAPTAVPPPVTTAYLSSSSGGVTAASQRPGFARRTVRRPPTNVSIDYQLGGAYPLPLPARVVSRDWADSPALGAYTICRVNAFQAQPQEIGWWRAYHDDLLLRDAIGRYVVDAPRQEILLDISTPDKRARLAAIVGGWLERCAADGFPAVEPDNLDSYHRSQGRLTEVQAIEYVGMLAARADRVSLAVAQKNAVDLGRAGRDVGLDFAIAEECGRYADCDDYTSVYGDHVMVIEYTDAGFAQTCRTVGARLSVVQRDRRLSRPNSPGYVYRTC
ncbi:endo alpha-1,4 polygalactosaminidase [Micromonospora maritima]|uniref:endo alpha-1,4 polygalactosaminidase n=1 Tax=Micromonospora maritima TaxID=986711 RepID=UPI00157D0C93|nr:endo alpha-1,4 polygalactosaminidase [Micromonospora maritima]